MVLTKNVILQKRSSLRRYGRLAINCADNVLLYCHGDSIIQGVTVHLMHLVTK